jgi:hypothetical protein
MIQESVRELTADERAWLQKTTRLPVPYGGRQRLMGPEAWGVLAGVLFAIVMGAGKTRAGLMIALAAGGLIGGWQVAARAVHNVRNRKTNAAIQASRQAHAAQMDRELARVLQDGRATVKRVRSTAVVEIEPLEDEGTGYVFDVGEGRVLFIKGPDYFPSEDGMAWPNTEFEIVRAAADGRLLDVHCHGAALAPLRVVPRDEVDPERGWDEREEVLEMSVDDAVRTILRDR